MFRKQDTYSTYKPPFQETDEKIKDLEKQSERLWNIQDNFSDYSTKKKVRELTNKVGDELLYEQIKKTFKTPNTFNQDRHQKENLWDVNVTEMMDISIIQTIQTYCTNIMNHRKLTEKVTFLPLLTTFFTKTEQTQIVKIMEWLMKQRWFFSFCVWVGFFL